jgi:hypothetical protein
MDDDDDEEDQSFFFGNAAAKDMRDGELLLLLCYCVCIFSSRTIYDEDANAIT